MVGALTIGPALPHVVNLLGSVAWQSVVVMASMASLVGSALAKWWAQDGPYPFPQTTFDTRLIHRLIEPLGVRLATLGYFGLCAHGRHDLARSRDRTSRQMGLGVCTPAAWSNRRNRLRVR